MIAVYAARLLIIGPTVSARTRRARPARRSRARGRVRAARFSPDQCRRDPRQDPHAPLHPAARRSDARRAQQQPARGGGAVHTSSLGPAEQRPRLTFLELRTVARAGVSGGERAGAARAGARRARAGTHGGTVAYPARLISGSELDPSPGVTLLGRRSRLLLLRAEELRPRVHASAPAQIGARWGRAGAAGEVRFSCAGVTGLAMSSSMPTNTRPHPPHCAISRLLSGLRNTE